MLKFRHDAVSYVNNLNIAVASKRRSESSTNTINNTFVLDTAFYVQRAARQGVQSEQCSICRLCSVWTMMGPVLAYRLSQDLTIISPCHHLMALAFP